MQIYSGSTQRRETSAGLDTVADLVKMEGSQGETAGTPFEVASTIKSDRHSARDDVSYSKVSCSDSGAGDRAYPACSQTAVSISSHDPAADQGGSGGVSGTDYCQSEVETVP